MYMDRIVKWAGPIEADVSQGSRRAPPAAPASPQPQRSMVLFQRVFQSGRRWLMASQSSVITVFI